MIAVNWIVRILGMIFIGLLDGVAYTLVSLSYRVFLAVSELNLFGGKSGASQAIYDTFTQKIYLVLSVVMLFVFAYQLILLIVNPDGDGTKKTTGLLKELVISIALVVVLPVVFRYMTVFQDHVIRNNTIGAIVLGTAPTSSSTKDTAYGDSIGMTVLMAFYHPQGTGYNTFFDTLGNLKDRDEAITACKEAGEGDDSQDTCELWMDALEKWNSTITGERLDIPYASITWNLKIFDTIGEDNGTYYMWLISTGCALLVAWFFISYAIDLGTRAVKLGFLELIAPVPVMLKIVPSMKKSFETWKGELIKTYVELFLRLAVIFFIVKLCTLVPEFVEIIFSDSMQDVNGGILLKSITIVILILGLLKFAKEAPELFKSIMDNGGGMFKNLDLKPGAKRRIESNDYAMKGISTIGGGAVGVAANVAKRYNLAKENGKSNAVTRAIAALSAAPRGLISGGKSGWDNSSKTFKDMKKTYGAAVDDAHASLQRASEGDLHTRLRNDYRGIRNMEVMNSESWFESAGDVMRANKEVYDASKDEAEKAREARKASRKQERRDYWAGVGQNLSNRETESLNNIQTSLSTIENYMKSSFDKATEAIKKAMNDDLKKIYSGQEVVKVKIDEKGNKVNVPMNASTIKDYYRDQLINAKKDKISSTQMHAIASQYREVEKLIRNSKLDSSILNNIDAKIQSSAKKAGISNGDREIKNLKDLIEFTSGSDAQSHASDFVKAMEVMEDVNKVVQETKQTSDLYKSTQSTMKKASSDAEKK